MEPANARAAAQGELLTSSGRQINDFFTSFESKSSSRLIMLAAALLNVTVINEFRHVQGASLYEGLIFYHPRWTQRP